MNVYPKVSRGRWHKMEVRDVNRASSMSPDFRVCLNRTMMLGNNWFSVGNGHNLSYSFPLVFNCDMSLSANKQQHHRAILHL